MKVFLLGSGASAATLLPENAPVSSRFAQVLGDKVPDWPRRFPFLDLAVEYLSGQANVDRRNWALDSVWNGIDENYKLRRIVRDPTPPWPVATPSDRRLYSRFRPRFWDSFWVLAGWELRRAVAEVYGSQLQAIISGLDFRSKCMWKHFSVLCFDDVVVTTNYDLLVEAFCRQRWREARNYITKADFKSRSGRNPDAVGPSIVKLHGSLDWVFATLRAGQVRDYVERTKHGEAMRDVVGEIDLHEDGWERRPLLVAPVKYKDEFLVPGNQPDEVVEVLTAQWARFRKALEDADELRVFGYRFPPDDAYGNRILQEAAKARRPGHTLRIQLFIPHKELPGKPGVFEDEEVENRLRTEIFFRPDSVDISRCGEIRVDP